MTFPMSTTASSNFSLGCMTNISIILDIGVKNMFEVGVVYNTLNFNGFTYTDIRIMYMYVNTQAQQQFVHVIII